MKRWLIGFGLVVLACLGLLSTRSSSRSLLQDTDTAVLLATIRRVQNPWQWFAGDWPLHNHFYRPISTLAFEVDNALYGNQAWGYGLTNVLLVIACTLALFWFLRELTENPTVATASTLLFALWQTNLDLLPMWIVWTVALALLAIGIDRHRKNWKVWAPPPLILIFLSECFGHQANLQGVVTDWLPGRTASVMTLFVLVSLASYCRYERLGAALQSPPKGPLDPPATKGTTISKPGIAWPWIILSLASLALALGSYEQAVMAPALLLAAAVTLKLRGYRVRWGWQASFWLMLVAYLALRGILVPRDISQYQNQALRFGPGVWFDLGDYVLPAGHAIYSLPMTLGLGGYVLIETAFYAQVLEILSNLAVIYRARLHGVFVLAGYGMSVLAFLPMAWLVRFDHYHYLPLAFRSLFVVAVTWVFFDTAASALSPPGLQAPKRSTPAPGSLPRR